MQGKVGTSVIEQNDEMKKELDNRYAAYKRYNNTHYCQRKQKEDKKVLKNLLLKNNVIDTT